MDFELNADQLLLRSTIRRFVDEQVRPVARRWEQSGRYPDELIDKMKEMGLFGMTIPESYGGLGVSMVDLAIVFEEISRGWVGLAGVLGTHGLSCAIIARHGTEDQKSRYLPDLATGRRRTAIGLTEPDAGTDLQGISCRAIRHGDSYIVEGTKTWITNARHADPLPILVKTNLEAAPAHRGMSVLLIEAGTPGFHITRDLPKLGHVGTETCEIRFDNCRVSTSSLLGDAEGRGLQQVLSGLEIGRINVAARSLGIAQEAVHQALSYARSRHAFRQPIAEFQAVQLKLAEMATNVQAARLLTWWAATELDKRGRADTQACMAKWYASEAAIDSALSAMRIHGGIGYSKDLDIERLYRDAPLMAIGEGTNDIMKLTVARAMISEDLAP